MSQTDTQNDILERSGMSEQVFRKQCRLGAGIERKAVDIEEGVFEGHSAGIGNRDRGDDMIMPGAFSKTIKERVPTGDIKLLNGHQSRDTENVWGVVTDAAEKQLSLREREQVAERSGIDKEDAPTHVLWSKFDVFSGDAGMDALRKIDEGILNGLSIGFRTVQVKFVKDDDAGDDVDAELAWLRGNGVREIHELAWWETSLVTWGMNQAARVVPGSVKEVLDRSEMIQELDVEDVSEKQVRYTIRSLKELVGDADDCAAILDTEEADRAQEQIEESAAKVEESDVDDDAKEDLETLKDELSEKKEDAETSETQVRVETKAEHLSSPRDPEYDGTTESDWSKPSLDDFKDGLDLDDDAQWDDLTEDEKSEVVAHTLLGRAEADDFESANILPVVEPTASALNRNALENAKARAGQVEGISEETADAVRDKVDTLLEEEFDVEPDDDDESSADEEISVKVTVNGKEVEVTGDEDEVSSFIEEHADDGDPVPEDDDVEAEEPDEEEKSDEDEDSDDDSPESSEEKSSEEETDEEVAGDAGDGRSDEHFDEVASQKLAEMRLERTREKLNQTIEECKE